MIITLRPKTPSIEIEKVKIKIEDLGFQLHESKGENYHLFGLIGETGTVDENKLLAMDYVDKVIRVQEPYLKANRLFHPLDSVVQVGSRRIGGENFTRIGTHVYSLFGKVYPR